MDTSFTAKSFKGTKLFIGAPMLGGLCSSTYLKGMIDLSAACVNYGVPLNIFGVTNKSLVQKARNACVDSFLKSDATHFLFIDADIGFTAKDALYLLATMASDAEKKYDVLAGSYPEKTLNPKRKKPVSSESLVEVDYVGAGFMMVPRRTFERFIQAYPEKLCRISEGATEFTFFDCGIDPETKRYMAEDLFFCKYVKKMGGRIWQASKLKLSHQGMHVFK